MNHKIFFEVKIWEIYAKIVLQIILTKVNFVAIVVLL